jgi:predicted small lipoprotein YifL
MKKNSIFFVAAMAILTLAGCASRLPSAPIEINTNVPTAPVT